MRLPRLVQREPRVSLFDFFRGHVAIVPIHHFQRAGLPFGRQFKVAVSGVSGGQCVRA
jgi:hypothetical protein